MTLSSGTRLGPYEIQSAIGAGGMGEVHRAHDTRPDRSAEVRILPPAVVFVLNGARRRSTAPGGCCSCTRSKRHCCRSRAVCY
jgi:serine/threonine protein kinase